MEAILREHETSGVVFSFAEIIGKSSDEEHASWLAAYSERFVSLRTRGLKTVIMIDLDRATPLTANQRRIQSDWNREVEAVLRAVALGFTYIASSAVMRGVFTAIFWVQRPPVPHRVSSDFDDALSWGFQMCEQKGIRLSESARAGCRANLLKPRT